MQWCCSSRNFGASPTRSAGNGTGADDDKRMQVDSLKKGKEKGKSKHQNQKGTRTSNTSNTDINTCKICGRTGHWVKDCWRPVGGVYDHNTSNNSNTKKAKAKAIMLTWWKLETNQSSEHSLNRVVSFTDTEHDRSSLVRSRSGTARLDHGSDKQLPVDNQFPVFHKETRLSDQVSMTTGTVT